MPNQKCSVQIEPTGVLADQGKQVPLGLAYPLPNRGVNARGKGILGRASHGLPCEFAALLPCIIDK